MHKQGDTNVATTFPDSTETLQSLAEADLKQRFGTGVDLVWHECCGDVVITFFDCVRSGRHYIAKIERKRRTLRIYSHQKSLFLSSSP